MTSFSSSLIICYVIVYGIGYVLLLIGTQNLRSWINRLAVAPIYLQKIFLGLRLKIHLLWIFVIIWLGVHGFDQGPQVQFCKAISSFLLCLVFGDVVVLAYLLCFGKLIKNMANFYPILKKLILFAFVVLGIIVAANNLGYSISGLLTTLGIGGAAIAFASQNTIANLWATMSIILDRPFKEGDWIIIGTRAHGKVVSIGLRSTRLQTENQTLVVIPNSIIVNECIENKGPNTHRK